MTTAPMKTGLYHVLIATFARQLIERTLLDYDGNRTMAAEALGLQRTYLHRLIRVWGIEIPHDRARRSRAH